MTSARSWCLWWRLCRCPPSPRSACTSWFASIGRFLARHSSQLVCLGLKAICRPRHDGVTNIEDLISLPLTRLRSLEIADLRPELSTNEFTSLIRSAPNLTALTVSDYRIEASQQRTFATWFPSQHPPPTRRVRAATLPAPALSASRESSALGPLSTPRGWRQAAAIA